MLPAFHTGGMQRLHDGRRKNFVLHFVECRLRQVLKLMGARLVNEFVKVEGGAIRREVIVVK